MKLQRYYVHADVGAAGGTFHAHFYPPKGSVLVCVSYGCEALGSSTYSIWLVCDGDQSALVSGSDGVNVVWRKNILYATSVGNLPHWGAEMIRMPLTSGILSLIMYFGAAAYGDSILNVCLEVPDSFSPQYAPPKGA